MLKSNPCLARKCTLEGEHTKGSLSGPKDLGQTYTLNVSTVYSDRALSRVKKASPTWLMTPLRAFVFSFW